MMNMRSVIEVWIGTVILMLAILAIGILIGNRIAVSNEIVRCDKILRTEKLNYE